MSGSIKLLEKYIIAERKNNLSESTSQMTLLINLHACELMTA